MIMLKKILLVNPKILILLGSTALNAIIGNEQIISKARGKWIEKSIGSSKPLIIASFHPAFLMRQPEQKKMSWIDLKMVREKIIGDRRAVFVGKAKKTRGGLTKKDLPRKHYRHLTKEEVTILKRL